MKTFLKIALTLGLAMMMSMAFGQYDPDPEKLFLAKRELKELRRLDMDDLSRSERREVKGRKKLLKRVIAVEKQKHNALRHAASPWNNPYMYGAPYYGNVPVRGRAFLRPAPRRVIVRPAPRRCVVPGS